MNIKSPLKKFFTVAVWCLLGGTGGVLLIAAINSKNSSLCQGMDVEINGGGKAMFLNKRDIVLMLDSSGLKDLRNKKTSSFDLLKMEKMLRRNGWIKEVQLYFDNNQILKVRIQERQPAARLFTVSGSSFLIDSSGSQLSLTEKSVFRLPLFTGYPSEKFGLHRDSCLCRQILNMTIFLNQDTFWTSQVQEMNITPSKTFLLTPLIGNQVIEFGDGNDCEKKFHKLLVFYKTVITETGFEKYNTINLAYSNQIIATRKQGIVSRVDSIQARKNVMEMIRMARKMEADTSHLRAVKPLERNTISEQNLQSYDLPGENDVNPKPNNKH